jgi:hypothetical protein
MKPTRKLSKWGSLLGAAAIFVSCQALASDPETFTVWFEEPTYFSATPIDPHLMISDGSLVWSIGATAYSPFPYGPGTFADATAEFNFSAAPNFRITGYDVDYFASYYTDTYVVTGREPYPSHVWGNVGDTMGLSGIFNGHSVDASGDVHLTRHFDGAVLPSISAMLTLSSTYNFCVEGDVYFCSGYLTNSGVIHGITITPNVVAVPEPGTYAILLVGLATLVSASRWRGRRAG